MIECRSNLSFLVTETRHFVRLYPDSIKLSQAVTDDLKDALLFFKGGELSQQVTPFHSSLYTFPKTLPPPGIRHLRMILLR